MPTRDQLNQERQRALLRLLEELWGLTELSELQDVTELQNADTKVGQRQKAIDNIVADFQTARSDFDTAVSDYSAATTTADEFNAVVSAVQAQQSQIDEIVEYLVMTGDSL